MFPGDRYSVNGVKLVKVLVARFLISPTWAPASGIPAIRKIRLLDRLLPHRSFNILIMLKCRSACDSTSRGILNLRNSYPADIFSRVVGAQHGCFLFNIISTAGTRPIGVGIGVAVKIGKPKFAVISIPIPIPISTPIMLVKPL